MKPSLKPGLFNRRNLRKAKPETIVQTTAKTFTYRQSVLYSPVLFTGQFYKQISPEDYSKKHLSYTAQLPLKITSLSILQDNNLVILDENNIGYNVYPPIEFEELFNTENFSFKWILEGTELPVNDVSLKLPVDNYFQNDNLLLDIVDSENNIISSNNISISEITLENWTPEDSELLMWLDASDNTTVTTDVNNKVTEWASKASSGEVAVQGGTPNYDNSLNGEKVIEFNDDHLYIDIPILSATHITFFIVFKHTNKEPGMPSFARNPANLGVHYYNDNKYSFYTNSGSSFSYTASNNNFTYSSDYQVLGADSEIHQLTTTGTYRICVGGDVFYRSSRHLHGFIAEYIIVPKLLTQKEKDKYFGYLHHKWGLVAQLPSNHPYKNNLPQSTSNEIATFTSVEIEQELNNVQINLTNSNGTYTPSNLTLEQMVNKNLIYCNWFVGGIKQSEKSASFNLPLDNSLQNSDIYLELIDSYYQTVNSNTITIQEITLWQPNMLSSLSLWLDVSDNSTITKDVSNNISEWRDKSGNNSHGSPDSNSPIYHPNYIEFNNSGIDIDLDFMAGQDHSFYIVYEDLGNYTANIYGAKNGANGSNSLHAGYNDNSTWKINYWANDYYVPISSNFIRNEYNIVNFRWFDNNGKGIYANGMEEGTTTQQGSIGILSGGGTILGDVVGQGRLTTNVQEIICILNADITQANDDKILGYLAHKWNLADKLPTNHPYKNTAP